MSLEYSISIDQRFYQILSNHYKILITLYYNHWVMPKYNRKNGGAKNILIVWTLFSKRNSIELEGL